MMRFKALEKVKQIATKREDILKTNKSKNQSMFPSFLYNFNCLMAKNQEREILKINFVAPIGLKDKLLE